MYNIRSRLVVIWSYGLNTVLLAAFTLALCSLGSEWVTPSTPYAKLTPHQAPVLNAHLGHPQLKNERTVHRAVVHFDVDADFTPCFGWNTKVVFAFIKLSYSTPSHPRNELNVWDQRITGVGEARFHLKDVVEYPLDDIGMNLQGVTVTAKMMYQTMFYSGYAPLREVAASEVNFTLSNDPVTRHINSFM